MGSRSISSACIRRPVRSSSPPWPTTMTTSTISIPPTSRGKPVNIGPEEEHRRRLGEGRPAAGLRFAISSHGDRAWSWYQDAQLADPSGPLAGVRYDGLLRKKDGKGLWWDGFDPQDLYAQYHRARQVQLAPAGQSADRQGILRKVLQTHHRSDQQAPSRSAVFRRYESCRSIRPAISARASPLISTTTASGSPRRQARSRDDRKRSRVPRRSGATRCCWT